MPAPPTNGLDDEVQIAKVSSQPGTIDSLLQVDTVIGDSSEEFSRKQFKDELLQLSFLVLERWDIARN